MLEWQQAEDTLFSLIGSVVKDKCKAWKSTHAWTQIHLRNRIFVVGNVQKDKLAVVVGWGVTTDCYHGNSKPWIRRLGHTVCRT